MKRRLLPWLAALALLPAGFAAAAAPPAAATAAYPADLPPADQALAAIRTAPQIRAADARLTAETAERERLDAGPNEWALRLTGQRRRVVVPDSADLQEWSAGLERPLRLPQKAGLDAEIGRQGEARARTARGDMLHEVARDLLQRWFLWLRESENATQWRQQVDSLHRQQQAVARRTALGDAARLELMLAEAATAQAEAALAQAELRQQVAAADLTRRYPALRLPERPPAATPQALEGGLETWREHLLEHHHELALARADSQRARLLAARAEAERTPDPTLGVHVGSERGGDERVAGLSLVLPLPGEARRATARRENALAAAAAETEAATLQRVDAEIVAAHAAATAGYLGWQRAELAAQRLRQTAALVSRAHQLGQAGLAEVLLAQRQENDGALAAGAARLAAQEARYRLLLDAHRLWAYDDDGDTN